jgi:hypothetical protein
LTLRHIARIVRGAPDRGGGYVNVTVNTPDEVREAALDLSMGIIADASVLGISRAEALAVFGAVWAEREASWTFND